MGLEEPALLLEGERAVAGSLAVPIVVEEVSGGRVAQARVITGAVISNAFVVTLILLLGKEFEIVVFELLLTHLLFGQGTSETGGRAIHRFLLSLFRLRQITVPLVKRCELRIQILQLRKSFGPLTFCLLLFEVLMMMFVLG